MRIKVFFKTFYKIFLWLHKLENQGHFWNFIGQSSCLGRQASPQYSRSTHHCHPKIKFPWEWENIGLVPWTKFGNILTIAFCPLFFSFNFLPCSKSSGEKKWKKCSFVIHTVLLFLFFWEEEKHKWHLPWMCQPIGETEKPRGRQ